MKRPALRGDVTRAGVTCDARPLSCFLFESSVLPLHWAFRRSRMCRNLGPTGEDRGGAGGCFFQPPRILCIVSTPNSEGENPCPSQGCTYAPTPRFSPLEVHGCHLPRRMGTNRLKRVDTGLLVFRMKSTAIGRENPAGKIIDLLFISPKHFGNFILWTESVFMITAG